MNLFSFVFDPGENSNELDTIVNPMIIMCYNNEILFEVQVLGWEYVQIAMVILLYHHKQCSI
jgi:hypothetical protein